MDEKNKSILIKVFDYAFVIFLGLVCYSCGKATGVESIRKDAVANGAAKYTVNEKTGDTKFTWIRSDEK